jgi:hypothetical protein
MALPYICSGFFQTKIINGFIIALVLVLGSFLFANYKYQFFKAKKLQLFSKFEIIEIITILLAVSFILMPGMYSDGYFIPNSNFDFAFQVLDSKIMNLRSATEFNKIIEYKDQIKNQEIPFSNFEPVVQGRYLCAVLTAVVSNFFYLQNYFTGAISVFIFFYFTFVISVYCIVKEIIKSYFFRLLIVFLIIASPISWTSIKYGLIGQLSAIPIFFFLIAAMIKNDQMLLNNNKYYIFILIGFISLIYSALSFVSAIIIFFYYLINWLYKKISTKDLLLTSCISSILWILMYISPNIFSLKNIISFLKTWYELIYHDFFKHDQINFVQVFVEYLSDFILLRILGFEITPFLSTFLKINSVAYYFFYAFSLILLIVISFKVKNFKKNKIFLQALWLSYVLFCLIFYFSQAGYLVFKTLIYMSVVPFILYLFLYKKFNSKEKIFFSLTFLFMIVINLHTTLSTNNDYFSQKFGAQFSKGIGASKEFISVSNFLKEIKHSENKNIWYSLSNPHVQAFVLLASDDYIHRGIKNNKQIILNYKWEDNGCSIPEIKPNDLVVVDSVYAPISDAGSKTLYVNPIFENSLYAVVEFKNIREMFVFSDGFYAPEYVNLNWNNTFHVARWSSGESAFLSYSKKPISLTLEILTYSDLNLDIQQDEYFNKSYFLQRSDSFQRLILNKSKEGWSCIKMNGKIDNLNFKQSMNRIFFKKQDLDGRFIKYLVSVRKDL